MVHVLTMCIEADKTWITLVKCRPYLLDKAGGPLNALALMNMLPMVDAHLRLWQMVIPTLIYTNITDPRFSTDLF